MDPFNFLQSSYVQNRLYTDVDSNTLVIIIIIIIIIIQCKTYLRVLPVIKKAQVTEWTCLL